MTNQPNQRLVLLAVAALCGWLWAAPVLAQTPPPSPLLEDQLRHLIGIENRIRGSLEQQPNYTCQMEIRRAHLGAKAREKLAKKIEKLREHDGGAALRSYREGGSEVEVANLDIPMDAADAVALEVAIVDGKELYAFPDSTRFEDRPLAKMIGHGTVSTGSFAGHARSIFVNNAGRIEYAGEEFVGGERVRRYDYEVELFRSGYSVSNEGQTAVVPYFGSFWAAADSDELRRLTVRADDIPDYVGVDEFTTQIDYQTLQLNSEDFIVPLRARLTMLLTTGVESVNETEYKDCRSFVGSSTLSFDDSTSQFYVEKVEEIEDVDLPDGLRLPVRLITPIDSDTTQVGSPVRAELTTNVRYGTDTVLPKGAVLNGRIRRFEFYKGTSEHYVVGIEFLELSFDSGRKRADVSLTLERIATTMGVEQSASAPVTRSQTSIRIGSLPTETRTTVETYVGRGIPGVGMFYVRGHGFVLKPGFRMTWKTVIASQE